LFVVDVSARDAAKLPDVQAAVDAALAKVASEGVAPERLAAIKSREKYALLSSLEKDSTVAEVIAGSMQITGSLEWINEEYAALDGVTNDDIRAFVQKYLVPANRT